MKKLFIAAFALLFAGVANAQTKGPSIGVKGGANFSNIIKTGDSNFETGSTTGFHAGVFLNIPIVDRLSFQPELLFSQKGYETESTGLFINRTFKQTTNWIDVPILAMIHATPKFHIVLGPQVSFLTKTKNEYNGTFGSAEQTKYEDDSDKFKKSIVGGVAGIGFDITNNISLNGRYNLDLQKNNKNGTSEIPEFRNQVWQVGLGLKF